MKPYNSKLFGHSYWNCKCQQCGNPKSERKAEKKSARQWSKKEINQHIEIFSISRLKHNKSKE